MSCPGQTWSFIRHRAEFNTAVLQHVFPQALPSDRVRSLHTLKQVSINGTQLPLSQDTAFVLGTSVC